jgi:hypothetical protein
VALGLWLVGAALLVPATAAAAQDGSSDTGSAFVPLVFVGVAVLAAGTILLVGIRRRSSVRQGGSTPRSRSRRPDVDLSLSDLSLSDAEPLSLEVEPGAESPARPDGANGSAEPSIWSPPADRPSSTFDDKMQEFLRELRSYH